MTTLASPPPPSPLHLRPLAPPRRPPSIADRVARVFPPAACVRGYYYFDRKRIDLAISSESKVDAIVKGKRTQQVCVQVQGARLGTRCTCTAQTLGPAACRHVWATLLEIDRIGALEVLRGSRAALALAPIDAATKPAQAKQAKPEKPEKPEKKATKSPSAKRRR